MGSHVFEQPVFVGEKEELPKREYCLLCGYHVPAFLMTGHCMGTSEKENDNTKE